VQFRYYYALIVVDVEILKYVLFACVTCQFCSALKTVCMACYSTASVVYPYIITGIIVLVTLLGQLQ